MSISRNRYVTPTFSCMRGGFKLRFTSSGAGPNRDEAGPEPPIRMTLSVSGSKVAPEGSTISGAYRPELSNRLSCPCVW